MEITYLTNQFKGKKIKKKKMSEPVACTKTSWHYSPVIFFFIILLPFNWNIENTCRLTKPTVQVKSSPAQIQEAGRDIVLD